jgi:hypothetical protein
MDVLSSTYQHLHNSFLYEVHMIVIYNECTNDNNKMYLTELAWQSVDWI